MKHIKLFESFDSGDVVYHGTKKEFVNFDLDQSISNSTYGASPDNGLGIFFTNNMVMAKWFAGLTDYSAEEEAYVHTNGEGRVISAKLDLKNPLVFSNSDNKFEDSVQEYFDYIEKEGGVKSLRQKLKVNKYDGIVIEDATTNYYEDGTYDVYVVLDPSQIKVVSKNVVNESNSKNNYQIRQELKKRSAARTKERQAEIDDIQLTDEEILDILIEVKSKKYDVLANFDKMKKLQRLGLVKDPNSVQKASSFGFPFYLTAKGEKLIK